MANERVGSAAASATFFFVDVFDVFKERPPQKATSTNLNSCSARFQVHKQIHRRAREDAVGALADLKVQFALTSPSNSSPVSPLLAPDAFSTGSSAAPQNRRRFRTKGTPRRRRSKVFVPGAKLGIVHEGRRTASDVLFELVGSDEYPGVPTPSHRKLR